MAIRRWKMKGLFKRSNSNIWQGRFRIDEDIWRQRDSLVELGVNIQKTQSTSKSTGEELRAEAEAVYLDMLNQWQSKLEGWEELLNNGAKNLTSEQIHGLVKQTSQELIAKRKPPIITSFETNPNNFLSNSEKAFERMKPTEKTQFRKDLIQFIKASPEEQRAISKRWMEEINEGKGYRFLFADIIPSINDQLEEQSGRDTDKLVQKNNLAVTSETRRQMNFWLTDFKGEVTRSLVAADGGDYRDLKSLEQKLDAIPDFKMPLNKGKTSKKEKLSEFHILEVLKSLYVLKEFREKTWTDYKGSVNKFIQYSDKSDVRDIEKADVRKWRDHMRDVEKLDPVTINRRRIAALSSVLNHAVKEYDLKENVAKGLQVSQKQKIPVNRSLTPDDARKILAATFKGSKRDYSVPHKRAIFWLPWIMAYTGLRAGEVAQLQGRSIKEENGIHFILVTPDDGSTKGDRAWHVGIHRHLIELGILDMVKSVGDGPLFYSPTNDNTTAIQRRQYSYKRVGDWVRDEVGVIVPNGRVNHAWRHVFTTKSRGGGNDAWDSLGKECRDYMMGSASRVDAREGYGEWTPRVTDKEINKLPKIEIEETDWRPD